MATQKENYVIALMNVAQITANNVMDKGDDLVAQYFDLGFNGGGSDPIVDGDLANFNETLTAADVANIITALQQISNYFNNAAVTTADYAVSFNNVRYVTFGG